MRHLRTLPTNRLIVAAAAVVASLAGLALLAVAATGSGGATPAPAPLADAIHEALAAPAVDGVTARVTFTNRLFPSGALLGNAGPVLMSGGSGRLWVTNDGRGRLELQSNDGDAQIVWSKTAVTVYDASSNTAYTAALPAGTDGRDGGRVRLRRSRGHGRADEDRRARGCSRARSRPTSPGSRPTA